MKPATTAAALTEQSPVVELEASRPSAAETLERHNTLAEENVYVGLMFGSKALVQLGTNPWIGPLTNKFLFRKIFFQSLN